MEGEGLSIDMTWTSTSSAIEIGKLRASAFKSFVASVTCLFACSLLKKRFGLEFHRFAISMGSA